MIQLAKSYLLSAQFFSGRLVAAPGNAMYIQALRMRAIMPRLTHEVHSLKQSETQPISTPTYRSWMLSTFGVNIPTTQRLLYLLSVLSGEQSIRQIELCEDKIPDSPYMEQLRFEMLADQGHEDEAIQGYQHLRQTHPELPELRYSLGMLYRKQRRWNQALANSANNWPATRKMNRARHA